MPKKVKISFTEYLKQIPEDSILTWQDKILRDVPVGTCFRYRDLIHYYDLKSVGALSFTIRRLILGGYLKKNYKSYVRVK